MDAIPNSGFVNLKQIAENIRTQGKKLQDAGEQYKELAQQAQKLASDIEKKTDSTPIKWAIPIPVGKSPFGTKES